MDPHEQVEQLLKRNGAKLLRTKKHHVYKLANGQRWTVPHTPSDTRSWQNCLSDLRSLLNSQKPAKTHLDFEHKKKPAQAPQVKATFYQELLVGLPARDVLPAPPPAPNKLQREKMELEKQMDKFMGDTIYPMAGKVPLRRTKGGRAGRGIHCGVFTYSPEVLAHANFLLRTVGEVASNEYLRKVSRGEHVETKQEEVVEMEMKPATDARPSVSEGGLEQEIRQAREQVRSWKAKEQEAKEEVIRAERYVQALEGAHALRTMSRAQIRELSGNGNGSGGTHLTDLTPSGRFPKGFWTKIIVEIVGTTPMSLTRRGVCEEMLKTQGLGKEKYTIAYAALGNALTTKLVREDDQGFIRLVPTKGAAG
jgi:hypothetical protein